MRLALPLMAAAAYMFYRSRSGRRAMAATTDRLAPDTTRFTDDGAESPNGAERLQVTHARGAFSGLGSERGAPKPALRDSDPDEITTGLPDLTRGA
jgi:hypothetical protein